MRYETVTCPTCGGIYSNAPARIKCPSVKGVLEHFHKHDPNNWELVRGDRGWQLKKVGE